MLMPIDSISSTDWLVYYDWYLQNVTESDKKQKNIIRPSFIVNVGNLLKIFEKYKIEPLLALVSSRSHFYDPKLKKWGFSFVPSNIRWCLRYAEKKFLTNPVLSPEIPNNLKKEFFVTLICCKERILKSI